MIPWIHSLNGFTETWLSTMCHASIEGAVVFGVAWLVSRAFVRLPAQLKCWVWRVAYAKMLVALVWISPLRIPLLQSQSGSFVHPPAATKPQLQNDTPAVEALGPGHLTDRRPSLLKVMTLADWALACWILGCFGCAVRLFRRWRKSVGVRAEGRLVRDAELQACCAELCQEFGVSRPPMLLTTTRQFRPVLFGIMRPAIILPTTLLTDPNRKELRLILAHELAHLRRRDLWWNWLPALGSLAFSFHPLSWLGLREWRLTQEIACDELAVAVSHTSAADYAGMLLRVAEEPASLATLGAVGTLESYRHLERRFIAMKQFGSTSNRLFFSMAAAISLFGIVGVVPWRVVARQASENPSQVLVGERSTKLASSATTAPGSTKSPHLAIPATIQAKAKVELHPRLEGVIEKINFEEGAPVKKGQLLVQLTSSGMAEQLRVAEAELRTAELDYRRLHAVEDQHKNLVAQEDLDKAESALARSRAELEVKKEQLGRTRVTAPFDGVMGLDEIQPGQTVAPGTVLGTLYDLSGFTVQFSVAAAYIHQVRPGLPIQVQPDYSAELLDGEVSFVAPAIDEGTRTFQGKAKLAKSKYCFRPGMPVTVMLALPPGGSEKP